MAASSLVDPLLPSESDGGLHCCVSPPPLSKCPGLVQDPTLLLSSPTEAWINRYRKQLVRSISPQFLEEIICYLRRLDLLTAEEASQVQEASSLPEQVRAVVDVLSGKGSYASQSLQTFIETTNSQLYLHITVYGRQPSWDPVRGVCTLVPALGAGWSTPRGPQSWAVLAGLMGASMHAMVPSQGFHWGRTQPVSLCQV